MQLIHFVLGTPACSPSEGGRGGGGGAHSCPWSAGETPAPTASGWWVGPGGKGERTSCSLAIYCVCCKCCRHWSKTRFGYTDCRRGRGGAGWGWGLSVGWGQESKGEERSRVGTGPKCS